MAPNGRTVLFPHTAARWRRYRAFGEISSAMMEHLTTRGHLFNMHAIAVPSPRPHRPPAQGSSRPICSRMRPSLRHAMRGACVNNSTALSEMHSHKAHEPHAARRACVRAHCVPEAPLLADESELELGGCCGDDCSNTRRT